ncbi:MAG TPA: DUF3617 family protein [Caulobacteraceae bacterium]|nr:DUF3617 family protein [Caulobacteraceae bacterium]
MRTLTSGERRHVALMCGIALAFGSGAVALAAVSASGPLHRKAGLWEQHLKIDDGSYPIPVATMCIDAKAEERLTLVGAQMDRRQCSSYQMTGRGDGSWSFLSVCEIDPGATVTTKGSATGDFRTTYSVEATGSTTGAAQSSMNGVHHIAIDARWAGPCPKGQTGGDVTTGGKTSNVFSPAVR